MNRWSDWLIPLLTLAVLLAGWLRGVDLLDAFGQGVRQGLETALGMFPALLLMITTVSVLKASGALQLLCQGLAPLAQAVGLPGELVPLALLRPLSGSGALALFESTLSAHGPDSATGRIASVLMGSTETTFYTIALYYGAVGVTKTRHTVACSLAADLTGFLASAAVVMLLFP